MAVVDGDIKFYGAASMPDDDVATNIGGAIDLTRRVVFTDIDPDGLVEAVSDNAADTMNLTIHYVRNDGAITSETKALNGTTPVDFTDTMHTILKAILASAAAGTVTIRKDGAAGNLINFAPGELEVRRVFYNALADEAGGVTKNYYDKIFIKNTNGTSALTTAQIQLLTDPEGVISFALETVLNGATTNGGGNNRQVAPTGFVFDATTKGVANSGSLTAGAAQGVWLRLTLAPGLAAKESTFTLRLAGVAA